MKKTILLFSISFLIISCSKENTDYSNLINKHISNVEVENFLNKIGSDFKMNDNYGRKTYKYENDGIELSFTKTDTLKAIFFFTDKLANEIQLPYGLKKSDTRKDVESKIGKQEKLFAGLNNLNVYYFDKHLSIRYKSKDTVNMNNAIKHVSVQKWDKKPL